MRFCWNTELLCGLDVYIVTGRDLCPNAWCTLEDFQILTDFKKTRGRPQTADLTLQTPAELYNVAAVHWELSVKWAFSSSIKTNGSKTEMTITTCLSFGNLWEKKKAKFICGKSPRSDYSSLPTMAHCPPENSVRLQRGEAGSSRCVVTVITWFQAKNLNSLNLSTMHGGSGSLSQHNNPASIRL